MLGNFPSIPLWYFQFSPLASPHAELEIARKKSEMENKARATTAKVAKLRITSFKGTLTDWVTVYTEERPYSHSCGITGKSEDVNRYSTRGYRKGVSTIWNKARRQRCIPLSIQG